MARLAKRRILQQAWLACLRALHRPWSMELVLAVGLLQLLPSQRRWLLVELVVVLL